MVAMGDLMFFKSHTFTVRSSLPETTLSPTVNTADVTVLETNTETEAHSYDSEGNQYIFFFVRRERSEYIKATSRLKFLNVDAR